MHHQNGKDKVTKPGPSIETRLIGMKCHMRYLWDIKEECIKSLSEI